MMDDGMLSQDEIDALLNVGSDDDTDVTTENKYLSSIEEDTIGEIGNISFGSSATTLSTLLGQKVEITTPAVSIVSQSDLDREFNFDHICVKVNYVEGFTGKNIFIIKTEDAAVISDIMLGGDGTNPETELNDIHLSAIQEAMNQMMGTAATSMSTIFNKKVDISPPTIDMKKIEEIKTSDDNDADAFVKVLFQLKVGSLIDSNIMQVMPIQFSKEMANDLLNVSTSEIAGTEEQSVGLLEPEPTLTESIQQPKQKMITEQRTKDQKPQFIGTPVDTQQAVVQQAVLSEFEDVHLNQHEKRNLDMLLDIPLKVTVELGRTKRSVKDILSLKSGSIVELDKLAGEPVDILVNDKLVAQGEVVVIDENFGVRITDIINQTDRLMKLK